MEESPSTEQRAEDQDAAMEKAFVDGTLPEADRREEAPEPEPKVEAEPEPAAAPETAADPEPEVEEVAAPRDEPIPEKVEPVEKSKEEILHRVHDIIDHVQKNCDPADRILIAELREILVGAGGGRPS